jgi:hypothetical protein
MNMTPREDSGHQGHRGEKEQEYRSSSRQPKPWHFLLLLTLPALVPLIVIGYLGTKLVSLLLRAYAVAGASQEGSVSLWLTLAGWLGVSSGVVVTWRMVPSLSWPLELLLIALAVVALAAHALTAYALLLRRALLVADTSEREDNWWGKEQEQEREHRVQP